MADTTRSLGWEEGTELLLHLIYLRWAMDQDTTTGGWDRLRDDLLSSTQPDEVLGHALERHVPSWEGPYRSVAQDGGHALRQTVGALGSWPLDSSAEPAFRQELHA